MWSRLDRPAAESVRGIALGFLDEASAALARLDDSSDEEALHDFRVSIRRLRTTLRAYRPVVDAVIRKKERKGLRELMRATGGGRDAEVQLAWVERVVDGLSPEEREAARRLATDLRREKEEGYARATEAVRSRFERIERRLRRRLCRLPVPEGPEAGAVRSFAAVVERVLPEFAVELGDALDALESADDRAEAHAARIRGKRVRYVLEPLRDEVQEASSLVDRLKDLQDALGDLRDLQLVETRIPSLPDGTIGAARLAGLVREAQTERFESFRRSWKGPEVEAFFADLHAACERIGEAAPDGLEIERKYLLSGRPDGLESAQVREIDQGYLPGDAIQERIRRIREDGSVRYVRTIKLGAGVVRTEVQEEIDAELFERLWPLTEGRRVTKRRHRIFERGLVWEVDEFTCRDLWLAEVELPSADSEPEPPDWLAPFVEREVTDEPEYLNVNLAR